MKRTVVTALLVLIMGLLPVSVYAQRTPADACLVTRPEGEPLLDRTRRQIFELICRSAADFDKLFGDRRFDEQARQTNGRVSVRLLWDERNGFEPDGKLSANVEFPNLDNRVNAFLGRTGFDNFVLDRESALESLPSFFESHGDEEWLAGLGYRPVRGDRDKVDVDVGVEAGAPIETFARARYRHHGVFAGNLLRFRQTVYWTNERHLGASTRLDLERPLGETTLGRWTVNAATDGKTEGTDWESGVTVFHGFTPHRAIAWYTGLTGKSGGDVALDGVGTTITYRRRMLREWFFGEFIAGLTWSRTSLDEGWQPAPRIGFGFEMQFSGQDLGSGTAGPVEDQRAGSRH